VHRVAFYETDAMGIVHHSNYVRFFELARVVWMDEHDRPYREYAAEGLHFATTALELAYRRSTSFDDVLSITTWLAWVKRASLRMAYEILRGDELVASGASTHAMVDRAGRPCGIPPERRAVLRTRLTAARS
jgi:acyl-CoA thioester hydrolase